MYYQMKEQTMNLLQMRITDHFYELNSNEKEVLKNILLKYQEIPTYTITNLSHIAYTSTASLSRLIKKLGFSSFSEFKVKTQIDLDAELEKNLQTEIEFDEKEYLKVVIQDIKQTLAMNHALIDKIAQLLARENELYIYGTGSKQKEIVKNFANDLLYFGKRVQAIRNSGDLSHMCSNVMSANAVLVVLSLNGRGENIENSLTTATARGITLITITIDSVNTISKLANYALYYKDSMANTSLYWTTHSISMLIDVLVRRIIQQCCLSSQQQTYSEDALSSNISKEPLNMHR